MTRFTEPMHLATARVLPVDLDGDDVLTSHRIKRRKTAISEPHRIPRRDHFLINRAPMSGDYVPITFSDGRRRYLCIEHEENGIPKSCASLFHLRKHECLVPDELSKLVQNAEQLV